MLYLFDIDGTLVDTGGAGMKSLQEASLQIFGHEGPALDLAGSTDLGIVTRISRSNQRRSGLKITSMPTSHASTAISRKADSPGRCSTESSRF